MFPSKQNIQFCFEPSDRGDIPKTFPGSYHSARRMLGLKLLPLLLGLLPWSMVCSLPAKCEKREFAETQTKYQQCAAAKIDSISKALEVRDCKVYLAHDHLDA